MFLHPLPAVLNLVKGVFGRAPGLGLGKGAVVVGVAGEKPLTPGPSPSDDAAIAGRGELGQEF